MNAPDRLADLRLNPDWAKLPLFERKGWQRMRFGDFAESINERVEPADAADEPYVGLEDLDPGDLRIRRWGKGSDVIGTKLRFRKGDIIFGRRRAYQRKLAVAEFGGICSAHAMVVRAKPEVVLPEFLPFLMMSDRFMKRAVEISVGSLSPTINWKTLNVEEFDVPPREQQRRLATLVVHLSDAGEARHALIDSCRVTAGAYLSRFLSQALGGKVLRVRKTALGEFVHLQTGIAKGKKYSAERLVEVPYLRVANVKDGFIDITEMKTIAIPVSERNRYALREGDVVICEGGDFDQVGRGGVWRCEIADCLHQNHIFALRADPAVLLPEFLAYQLGSEYGKKYFLSCAKKTSNLASINATQVRAFPLVLPPLDAQKTLVSKLDTLLNARSDCEQALASSRDVILRVLQNVT